MVELAESFTAGHQTLGVAIDSTNINASQPSTELIFTEIPTTDPPADINI